MLGDITVEPQKGNVGFGSGLHAWGFTLTSFARIYGKKYGIPKEKMLKRLWGDMFYNKTTKKWGKKPIDDNGKPNVRGLFCTMLCLIKCF